MAKFKVIVQVYKEYVIEAEDVNAAKEQVKQKLASEGVTERYNINEPSNLTARAAHRKEWEKKKKAEKEGGKNEEKTTD